MEASIRDPNLKNFVRLLQCAARFGDDLSMHVNKDAWELAVTNSTKSAFCLFTLYKAFFDRYRPLGSAAQQRRGVKCQLLVKSVLNVIGKASSVNAVERLDLRIVDPEARLSKATQDDEEDDPEDDVHTGFGAKLELKLLYKHGKFPFAVPSTCPLHFATPFLSPILGCAAFMLIPSAGIIKKHLLHLGASEFFRADVDPDSTPSGLTIDARALRDWLDHFSLAASTSGSGNSAGSGSGRNENQLGWMFSTTEVRVKSWEGSSSALSTEIKVNKDEFDNYEVAHETGRVDLTLPMKEFKAALQLAEQLGMTLDISFSEGSQPLTITSRFVEAEGDLEIDQFKIFCAIATTRCDAFKNPTSVPAAANLSRSASNGRATATPSAAGSLSGLGGNNANRNTQSSDGTRERRGSQIPSNSVRSTSSRSRLSMSTEHDRTTVNAHLNGNGHSAGHSQSAGTSTSALFTGSQVHRVAGTPLFDDAPMPASQQVMTQREAMELSGFGDMDPQDLLNGMDDADDDGEGEGGVGQGGGARDGGEDGDVPAGYDDLEMESFAPPPQRSLRPFDGSGASGRSQFDESFSDTNGHNARASSSAQRRRPSPEAGDENDPKAASNDAETNVDRIDRGASGTRRREEFEIDPDVFNELGGGRGTRLTGSGRRALSEIEGEDETVRKGVGGEEEEDEERDDERMASTQSATQFQSLFPD